MSTGKVKDKIGGGLKGHGPVVIKVRRVRCSRCDHVQDSYPSDIFLECMKITKV
jgi:hypothetical protein